MKALNGPPVGVAANSTQTLFQEPFLIPTCVRSLHASNRPSKRILHYARSTAAQAVNRAIPNVNAIDGGPTFLLQRRQCFLPKIISTSTVFRDEPTYDHSTGTCAGAHLELVSYILSPTLSTPEGDHGAIACVVCSRVSRWEHSTAKYCGM
jgi:hypothetical protein